MLKYIWLIPTLPLAGSALIGLLGLVRLRRTGEKLGKRAVSAIALASVGLSFVLSVLAVYQLFAVEHRELFSLEIFVWLRGGSLPLADGGMANFEAPWGYLLDPLSAVMILVVTEDGGTSLVHLVEPIEGLRVVFSLKEDRGTRTSDPDPSMLPWKRDLTFRELDIIHELAVGHDCHMIANRLMLSTSRVWDQISSCVKKLETRTRVV